MTDTDPTNLHALETGYDEGYNDALLDVNRQLRDAGIDPADLFGDGVEARTNPYTKLFDDRREYVEQQVREAFTVVDEDGDDVFEQTDFIDAILDAHADWMVAHTPLVRRTFAGIDLDLAGIDDLRDRPMIDSVLAAYVAFRDADAARRSHASDCALHSEPAGAARPCDCANRSASNEDTKPEPVQVDDWPTVDDENAAQNEIARAVVSAALALGISHIKLSDRYDIARRVVNEIQARFR